MQVSLPLVRMAHPSADRASDFLVDVTNVWKARIERSDFGQTVKILQLLAGGLEREMIMSSLGDWPGILAACAIVERGVVSTGNYLAIRTLRRCRDC